MVQEVDRYAVQRLLEQGAQLVDVMPAAEFAESHIRGAIHIPLRRLADDGPRLLDRDRPVILYCYDSL